MNLGIDFGSTRSCFSTFDHNISQVRTCTIDNTDMVASFACIDHRNRFYAGRAAQTAQSNNPNIRSFQFFKMLLTEKDSTKLRHLGYDDTYSPQVVTKRFLRDHIRRVLNDHGTQKIEKLVICAPEFWTSGRAIRKGMLDGKAILRDTCRQITQNLCGQAADVQVISEPAAASAYFAHTYKAHYHRDYTGHVLVIDYGGGTLDLTLTEVMPNAAGDRTEIAVRHQYGVGENEEQQIGKGGIAYMERVVMLALQELGITVDFPAEDPAFLSAVSNFEDYLKGQSLIHAYPSDDDDDDEFDDSEELLNAVDETMDDVSRLGKNHETFHTVPYKGRSVSITYAHLYRAYTQIIEPNLIDCLGKMTAWMDRQNEREQQANRPPKYHYQDNNADNFHIILVGGFGKFILVQKSVHKFFDWSATNDLRFSHTLGNDREYAVAKGAALLAGNQILMHHTAPFGVGIASTDASDSTSKKHKLAIRFREEIKPDVPKFIPGSFLNAATSFDKLVIGTDQEGYETEVFILKQEMRDRVDEAYQEVLDQYALRFPGKVAKAFLHQIGFSMDPSGVLTFLVRATKDPQICSSRELGLFEDMFVPTSIEEV